MDAGGRQTGKRIAFVLKGYPRLSESFIAQEIENLEKRGMRIDIWSLRHPTDKTHHPVHERIDAPVTYLPEYLHQEPFRVRRAWRAARKLPGYRQAHRLFRRDLARDFTRNRVRRFGQAMVLATETPDAVMHFHAHFLHTPSSVARYAAIMSGRTWSFSAHAKDIWTIRDWEKREKLVDALFGVTCTRAGTEHLNSLGTPERGPVETMLHGIDLSRFEKNKPKGRAGPIRLVSVGRAVPKKGYTTLLRALAALPEDLDWTFEHIGGGELRDSLKAQAETLGIAGRITWRGARSQEDVIELLGRADVFLLASQNQKDGDRDGIPNVLLEAMAMAVPVISTEAGAIPEAIRPLETGLLAPPGDHRSLSRAIEALSIDEALRQRLARQGREKVLTRFDNRPWADELGELFMDTLPEVFR